MYRTLLALLLCCASAGATPPQQRPNDQPLDGQGRVLYEQASLAFRERQFPAAYGRFMRLADAGHVASAQVALVMLQNGSSLFGHDWSASPEQQRRWTALSINAARQRDDTKAFRYDNE
jgi:hypothetical protein